MHLLACVLGLSLERALEETESPLARRLADTNNESFPLPPAAPWLDTAGTHPSPPPSPPPPPPPPPNEELLVASWLFFLFALALALLLCFGLCYSYPHRSRGHGAYVAYWRCCWPDPWVEERCCDDWDDRGSQRTRQREAALPSVLLSEPPPCR